MAKGDLLGAFEQVVMLALVRLGPDAYGMTVRQEIEQRTARPTSLGAVYATLDRLERKGYVRSRDGASSLERAGRGRRFFEIQDSGMVALEEALAAIDSMRSPIARPVSSPAG